jgi:hypothetical protein
MALIPTQALKLDGAAPTFAAAAANDTAQTGPGKVLIVKNASGSPVTVTLTTPGNLGTGDAYPDKVYTVAASGGERWIPLLPLYKDPTTGTAAVAYSATTSVTRAVVQSYN